MWLWSWLGQSEICRAGCQEGLETQAEVELQSTGGISSSSVLLLRSFTNWIGPTQIIQDIFLFLK